MSEQSNGLLAFFWYNIKIKICDLHQARLFSILIVIFNKDISTSAIHQNSLSICRQNQLKALPLSLKIFRTVYLNKYSQNLHNHTNI